jgi:selenocysteine lyase/cysteine desulfurase
MIYFDHAGLGIPREEGLRQEYEYKFALSRDPSLEMKYFEIIDRDKAYISKHIFGATNYSVSYMRNATEALTITSNVVPITADDEVIISDLEHRAGVNSWEYICKKKNAKLITISIDNNDTDEAIVKKYAKAISKKTKVMFCSHIDRNFGIIFPIKKLSALAKEHDVLMVIDGAQATGLIDYKLDEIDCGIYVSSFHKWCRMPTALGIMLTRKDLLDKLDRLYVGEKRLSEEDVKSKDFGTDELGTRNVSLEMCLPLLIDWKKEEKKNNQEVINSFLDRLKSMPDTVSVVKILNSDGRGFVVLDVVDSNCADMQKAFFDQYGIMIGRVFNKGKYYIRVSFGTTTKESDCNILIAALKNYARYNRTEV